MGIEHIIASIVISVSLSVMLIIILVNKSLQDMYCRMNELEEEVEDMRRYMLEFYDDYVEHMKDKH